MSDQVPRLADVIDQHTPSGAVGNVDCWCGENFDSFREHAEHLAQLIAAAGLIRAVGVKYEPTEGRQSYSGRIVGDLGVDTSRPDSVEFVAEERSCDRAAADLPRAEVERLHAQLGAWLRIDPPVGNVPCPTCGEYDPYDCTCPDRQRQGGDR